MSETIRVASPDDVPPGSGRVVEANGVRIAVFNVAGTYHAIDDACSHQGGPLSEGTLDGTAVTCPWHGARFDVTTGAVLSPPAQCGVASYPVRASGPDLLVELPAAGHDSPAAESRRTTLILTAKTPETPDVVSFFFRPEGPLSWQAGQFLRYTLPHPEPDDRGIARYFTIASAPFEGHVMLTTRFAQGRSSTFKQALRELPIDAPVEVDPPAGNFTYLESDVPHVLIAGGIGITPFRAMLLDRAHRELPVHATLLYANRTSDFVYRREVDALRRRHPRLVIRYLVSPQHITRDSITGVIPELETAVFLVSGPEPFVKGLEGMLSELGVPDTRLKRDYFPGYGWN
jgi:ferredoxin-NADP reductase/nitrite reductase/ring-hydroxylating ferredoxin subunit